MQPQQEERTAELSITAASRRRGAMATYRHATSTCLGTGNHSHVHLVLFFRQPQKKQSSRSRHLGAQWLKTSPTNIPTCMYPDNQPTLHHSLRPYQNPSRPSSPQPPAPGGPRGRSSLFGHGYPVRPNPLSTARQQDSKETRFCRKISQSDAHTHPDAEEKEGRDARTTAARPTQHPSLARMTAPDIR
jgi:hypothetical protein